MSQLHTRTSEETAARGNVGGHCREEVLGAAVDIVRGPRGAVGWLKPQELGVLAKELSNVPYFNTRSVQPMFVWAAHVSIVNVCSEKEASM